MTAITKTSIFDNDLFGTIGSLIGRLQQLQILFIYKNIFTGTIPSELAELKNLRDIKYHWNSFTGTTSNMFYRNNNTSLESFYTDCGNGSITDQPAVKCLCCIDCCDTMRETCMHVHNQLSHSKIKFLLFLSCPLFQNCPGIKT